MKHQTIHLRGKRLLLLALAFGGWLASGTRAPQAQQPPLDSGFAKTILPFVTDNCVACHNGKKAAGSLNLETLSAAASLNERRAQWEHIVARLHAGEMPPKNAPQPDLAERKAVIEWLEAEFVRLDKLVAPDPGRVTARRLNRAEYNNTVRDLLGVALAPADDFPQDDSGYGFDNIGDVLSLSPVLMEKYLTAAETVARTAVYGVPPLKPTMTERRGKGQRIAPSFTPLAEYDQTGLSLPNALHLTQRFPVEAEYTFKLYLNGQRPAGSAAVTFALWVDGQQVQTRALDPEGGATFSENKQDFDAFNLEFRTRVKAGDHWIAASVLNLYDGLPPSLGGANPSTKAQPPLPEFKERADVPADVNARRRKAFEDRLKDRPPVNNVRVSRADIGGPYNQTLGPTPDSRQKLFICGHAPGAHRDECATTILTHVANRAFRRPVTPAEVNQFTNLAALVRSKGDSFEEGICVALQAILVSPHFLFRIEREAPQTARSDAATSGQPINQYELASRLSYFLWSSMPDDELMRAAQHGTLRQPAVLQAQIARMLKDEKAHALAENFAGQWLELRKLESLEPDREKFPQYDEYLRMSIRRETELFFENIVRGDGNLVDFIGGKYSFLNERLARFYGVAGVKGPEFRRVSLADKPERGGILTQASVLTVSSYTTRTSPVLRGKWILENILNAPPPAPPADVPTLDDTKVGSSVSLRQQLEEHRKNPTCAACHARMDPLGFGLEKFNAIGAWRTMDGKFPVDDSGVLPDGRTFNGPEQLRSLLLADRDAFARCLAEKLLTYALGRGLERYDKPTVKQIAANVAAKDYKFSALVWEIANSLPFQRRRAKM
ncbi:MAG: DUF1592 domain-containing protein [Acidobacteria bacterium]|nr:DUF1592 domain-containing protein [Acidobacteriota bacterium]MBI3425412.1 DUF1592 domain-containing protein [Acidobacteriota bacterium]